MAKGVFIHNQSSRYDDQVERHYQFPRTYLKRAEQTVGDWIAYYESGKDKGRKSYKAIARVSHITQDQDNPKLYFAHMVSGSFLPLERLVPLRLDGQLVESRLLKSDGGVNGGLAIAAVRTLSDADFAKIIEYGLPDDLVDLPRMDSDTVDDEIPPPRPYTLEEGATAFDFPESATRDVITVSRKKRDRAFRANVLSAYDKTCAFTGLRFINGGGRAEVQAAHIKPVKVDGPDSVNNGLALSGTIHWMFDRGLLSLSNDYNILVSRHINNTEEIDRLLVSDRKARVPNHPAYRPHPHYLDWHRSNCFKT